MPSEPRLSVIIPHYDDLANLRRCVRLLACQTLPADRIEIIVADNNSACGLAAVRDACGAGVTVLAAPVQGAGAARNAGVAAARGRDLAFLDSDCRPAVDWIERGLAALATADMVGGAVAVEVDDPDHLSPVEAFELVFAFNNKLYVERKGFSITANMFVSRAVFDRVGGFRSGVAEDNEWGKRAVARGFRWVYAADARVAHPARRDWGELVRKWRRLNREAYLQMKERPLGRLRWLARSWIVLVSPFGHLGVVLATPRLERFGDRLTAAAVLFAIRWWRFVAAQRIAFET